MENLNVQPEPLEEQNSYGEIKINLAVIASIVRLAALEVAGVYGVGSGFVDQLGGIFTKRESDRGVKVQEDAEGQYQIEIRVIMAYGSELAKAAQNVQIAVRNQVQTMTGKEVSKVDVVIDGVRTHEEKKEAAPAEARPQLPTTD